MIVEIEELIGPALVSLFVVALLLETLAPRQRMPRVRAWRLVGTAFFLISAAINIGLPLLLPTEFIRAHGLLPGMRLGVAGGFFVGLVAWELLYYWMHRLEHRSDLLWRLLHQLHHSPQRMDVAGFSYTHPLEMVVFTVVNALFVYGLLGLDPRAGALVGLYVAVTSLVQHVNVRTPRWLEWFMQRPEAHARHHEVGQHAGNYADWPVVDKLFGTYRAPVREPLRYGFDADRAARVGAMLTFEDVHRNGPAMPHHE